MEKHYLGLDIGSACTKALLLSRKGKTVVIEKGALLDTAAEGILNRDEHYQAVSQWLAPMRWSGYPIGVAIPQEMANTMQRDYPGMEDKTKLTAMVNDEIRQVTGMSDEPLLLDYCKLPPGLGRKNPVLVGLCLETLVREQLSLLATCALHPSVVSIGGLALANAFIALKPQAAYGEKPSLLLELGQESTCAVVLAGGQPLFVGSLMVSGSKFQEAAKAAAALPHGQVSLSSKDFKDIDLREETGHSPYLKVALLLENEIQAALETWRQQETGELSETPFGGVYICGGVSALKGLREWLSERLETPVEFLGPEIQGVQRPEFAQAYGLALQTAGLAALTVSLLPQDVKQRQLRKANWPYLAAALGVLGACAFLLESVWYMGISRKISVCRDTYADLEQCGGYIERIVGAQTQLYASEAKVMPLVVAGSQGELLKSAIPNLGKVCGDNDWLVYFGDKESYRGARTDAESTAHGKTKPAFTDLFGQPGKKTSDEELEFPIQILPRNLQPPSTCVAVCTTINLQGDPYAPASRFRTRLKEEKLFAGGDILQAVDCLGREDILKPWEEWKNKNPRYFIGGNRQYTFEMTVAEPCANPKLLPDTGKGRGGKGKKGRKK